MIMQYPLFLLMVCILGIIIIGYFLTSYLRDKDR
jgi:uncharacterized protein YneF (UPF0154 family)